MKIGFVAKNAKWAKIAAICVCAAALVALSAVALMSRFSTPVRQVNSSVTDQQTAEPSDPVQAFITERDQLRSMQIAQLNDIIYGEKTDDETRQLAQRQMLTLLERQEKESAIEGILRVRGFEDAICTVHEDSVNIVVRAEAVTKEQSAVIYELVLRETGVTGGNVKIVPIN